MKDEKQDLVSQIVKAVLLVISCFYGIIVKAHHFFYKVNLLKSYKPDIFVISVGNITLGGTGKTPFSIMLAKKMAKKGKLPAVLIRGYGEDEWKVLEESLKGDGVNVLVGRDRIEKAREAERLGRQSIILDDGFQHIRLRRDLDIALIDATDPFGNRHLFPRGILRENISALKRADAIVLTKLDKVGSGASVLREEVKRIAPGKTIVEAMHAPRRLVGLDGSMKDKSYIDAKKVCVLSAICDPTYFRHSVEKTGALVGLEFIFPDHYSYRKSDIDMIFEKCRQEKIYTVIITEKDAVKIRGLVPDGANVNVLALAIELEIKEGEDELDALLGS
ncbi:tetraacyldisaccharide 4'-kinase [Candidatus Omnitrophota bacterium]